MVSETHNTKTNSSCNQGLATNLKANQADLKDTNFEYEDNEWDIGEWLPRSLRSLRNALFIILYPCIGIGDLIIDLDADIEKSSSSNLDSSLVIPLQTAANLTSPGKVSSVDIKKQTKQDSDQTDSNKNKLQAGSLTSKGKCLKLSWVVERSLIVTLWN